MVEAPASSCSTVPGAPAAVSPKARICYVTSVFPRYEGDRAASFLVEAIRHLRDRGYEISVFAPSFRGLGDHDFRGVRVKRFRYFPVRRWEDLTHDHGAPNKVRNPFYLFVAAFYIVCGALAFRRFCRVERFDVLHVHWPFPHGLFGLIGARQNGARLLLSFHGAELLLARRFPFVNWVLAWVLRRCHAVTANSSFTASQIARLSPGEVAVIPYGSTVVEAAAPAVGDKAVPEILFVGRLVERKGVEYLVRAMPHVLGKVSARLYVVGDGPCRPALERLTDSLGLRPHVVFAGLVPNEELAARYASCDVFVLPAIVDSGGDTEGLGVVLVEALTYQKPVVASAVGGIVDVIKHDETGLLVPERDPLQLAAAIVRVLSDLELSRRLGATGLAFARTHFDWDRITTRVADLYDRLLAPGPAHVWGRADAAAGKG